MRIEYVRGMVHRVRFMSDGAFVGGIGQDCVGLTSSGMMGVSARCASWPWPTSRLPGAPTRPVSPTELGGK